MQETLSPSLLPWRMGAGLTAGTGKRSLGLLWLPRTGESWKAAYLTAFLTPGQKRESNPERENDSYRVGVSSTKGRRLLCLNSGLPDSKRVLGIKNVLMTSY